MGIQRYDAYYKNDFNDTLAAMLKRSDDGDLVLYDDHISAVRGLKEALQEFVECLPPDRCPDPHCGGECALRKRADAALNALNEE